MKFYLGTHHPDWLDYETDIPFFVSYRSLKRRKKYKKTLTTWALDSGGFTELSMNGNWDNVNTKQFVKDVKWYQENIENLDFVAIQDWMCEPFILKKTGKSIKEHQELTCQSYLDLMNIDNSINWLPILQGWELKDYINHYEMYLKLNIDLKDFKNIGVGSVCRRQATDEIGNIVKTLYNMNLKLHGFGVKINGILKYGKYLTSSDSMAWSYGARYNPPLEGCTHKTCSNCFKYAKLWFDKLNNSITNISKGEIN